MNRNPAFAEPLEVANTTDVPEEMNAVVLDAYDGPASLRVARRAVPKPGPGQVLVKIAASPMNPSDIAFIHGNYGFRSPPPVVPGQEGAGTVVAAGEGVIGRYFLGKRVARGCRSKTPPAQCRRTWTG
jgi:NADPH:quinone reductase-like Zn-dependent oxidoreductase